MSDEDEHVLQGDPVNSLSSALRQGRTIAEFRASLPVHQHGLALLWAVETHQVTVIVGEADCGKSAQLPQYLYEAGWSNSSMKMACVQPRQAMARSAATQVAEEMGCIVGQTVGYNLLVDNKTGPSTRICYTTDNFLLRSLLYDPLLSKYSVIILDAAEERSLPAELLLGLMKPILAHRPDDFRLVIMTGRAGDEARFLRYFGADKVAEKKPKDTGPKGRLPAHLAEEYGDEEEEETPAKKESIVKEEKRIVSKEPIYVQIKGKKRFPYEEGFLTSPLGSDYIRPSIECVLKIARENKEGDILIFLPSKPDIDRALEVLAESPEHGLYPLVLYSQLPAASRAEIFKPAPRPRAIFATSLAESTSLPTSIRFVVDTGLARRACFVPDLGIERLDLYRISKSAATQRACKATYCEGGRVYRLYTRAEFEAFKPEDPSCLQTSNLAGPVLLLKALGVDNPLGFGFIEGLPPMNLACAYENLHALGAISDTGALTEDLGIAMSELPLDPPLARMLLQSRSHGCTSEILSIVSVLATTGSLSNILLDSSLEARRKNGCVEEGDLLSILNLSKSYRENRANGVKWAERKGLNCKNLERAEAFRDYLAAQLQHFGYDPSLTASGTSDKSPEPILKCILSGLFMNLARCNPDGSYRLIRDQQAKPLALHVHPESVLFNRIPDWVVFTEAVETSKVFMRNVSVVDPSWAVQVAPHYFKALRKR